TKYKIQFEEPQSGVAPGQSLVVYDTAGEECMGGGVIGDVQ
ncbi:MAG: tRNA 2-thiouridine(34) synthase MnmA, partial [Parcubacteria group bacterium]|nr:tRNA 2-thiouridine(34) synthase MnmA [Parcubacteria group bacterium]